jgi:hypothetical protein
VDSNDLLPPGLLVHGARHDIAADFAAVALMQPVAILDGGVACAPRAAPELARRGIAACRLPTTALPSPPGWPDPPSLTAGSWYLRSPAHIPPPPGFRELVQVAGEGFGAWPHPTTLMCLTAIEDLEDGPAVDVGCGSGLLSQAWAALRGPVTALDIDPRAVSHALASLTHARPRHPVTVAQAPLARMLPTSDAPTLLANVPPIAHADVLRTLPGSARTVLVSGIRSVAAAPTLAGYHAAGFTQEAAVSRDGWGCWILRRGGSLPAP